MFTLDLRGELAASHQTYYDHQCEHFYKNWTFDDLLLWSKEATSAMNSEKQVLLPVIPGKS